MKNVCRIRIIVPVIYTVLSLFFLMIHFIQQDNFSRKIGKVELKGAKTVATENSPADYRSVSLLFGSFEYPFDSRNPVTITTGDKISHKLHIQDVTYNNLDIIIHFNNNINLTFRQNNDDSLDLIPTVPELKPPVESISLSLISGSILLPVEGFPEIYQQSGVETALFLHLPEGSKYTERLYRIQIPVKDSGEIKPVKISHAGPQKGINAEQWLATETPALLDADKILTEYNELVYDSMENRFNPGTGTWSFKNSEDAYSEGAINLLLSESLQRQQYINQRYLILNSSRAMENGISFSSSPFLGDIVNKGRIFYNQQVLNDNTINSRLESGDPYIMLSEGFESYLIRHPKALPEISELIPDFLETENPVEILPGLFNYLKAASLNDENLPVPQIRQFMENRIIPILLSRNDGFFLFPDSSKANIKASLYTARLLQLLYPDNENMNFLSSGLIQSVLSLSDEQGFLPEFLIFTDNTPRITREIYSGDYLSPESLANILFDSPYYPHFNLFTGLNDNPVWLWNSSNDVEMISRTSNEITYSIRFPRDGTHHLIFFNVEPFEQIIFKGLQFRSDYRFQSYSDGWFYDQNTKTLFFKITHQKEIEYITIRKTIPRPQSASTAAAQTE